MRRLPLAGLLLLRSRGCRRTSFSSSSSPALECRLGSCGARGFGAPQCGRSPRIRNRNPVPCSGRRIPIHCTTREFLEVIIGTCHVTLNIVPVTKAMWRLGEMLSLAVCQLCHTALFSSSTRINNSTIGTLSGTLASLSDCFWSISTLPVQVTDR